MKPCTFNCFFVATMVLATTANSATPYNLLLKKIANYTSFLDVGTNSLSNDTVHFDTNGGTDHIFVNANLARILLSTYRLQTKQQYENAKYRRPTQ